MAGCFVKRKKTCRKKFCPFCTLMFLLQIPVAVADHEHTSGFEGIHTFTDQDFLLIRKKIMQSIRYNNGVCGSHVKLSDIFCCKMKVCVAAETMIGNSYLFF